LPVYGIKKQSFEARPNNSWIASLVERSGRLNKTATDKTANDKTVKGRVGNPDAPGPEDLTVRVTSILGPECW
jgi:hypothetical protein